MEEDLQLCTNCEKKVPSAYFFLHEAHCLRFRAICPECKEVILKEEMKDHQENGHKQVQCSLCLQSMQKYLLDAHEAECPERLIKCEFCELAIPLSRLEEHETGCGGQTAPVLPAQLASHEALCMDWSKKPRKAGRKKVSCLKCRQDIPEGKLSQHWDECHQFTELMRSFDVCPLKRPEQPSPVPWDAEPAQASTGERVVRSKKKDIHEFKMSLSSWPAQGKKEEEYDVLEGCFHCQILLPLPVLKQHEEKCRHLASQSNGRFWRRGFLVDLENP
ncbi:XIAP-associated factor 1 isoform X2 [Trichosurus vulpecula]|uniref:XIAP-associated factor 1 isoform X2 n=1 Tax=Trichosurus vulpecula TaxID=9337 RepID=UPI00186AD20C|nr:XIAP-associated factor 1 isoform X2 [Trichosurus vulpecula]